MSATVSTTTTNPTCPARTRGDRGFARHAPHRQSAESQYAEDREPLSWATAPRSAADIPHTRSAHSLPTARRRPRPLLRRWRRGNRRRSARARPVWGRGSSRCRPAGPVPRRTARRPRREARALHSAHDEVALALRSCVSAWRTSALDITLVLPYARPKRTRGPQAPCRCSGLLIAQASVTAPRLAVDTSFAYFASRPLV